MRVDQAGIAGLEPAVGGDGVARGVVLLVVADEDAGAAHVHLAVVAGTSEASDDMDNWVQALDLPAEQAISEDSSQQDPSEQDYSQQESRQP